MSKELSCSFDMIQTPIPVWTKILELFPIKETDIFFEPFRGTGNLFNQVKNENSEWCEITQGKDIFQYDCSNSQVTILYTNPPYICSIPDKKGKFKQRNAVYFFMEYFMTNLPKLQSIGFIMNMKCFNSFTPKRLKKLNDLGFTISSITMFNCNYWYGLQLFVIFDRNPNTCFKYIEKTFVK